jgi:hypothetical protein
MALSLVSDDLPSARFKTVQRFSSCRGPIPGARFSRRLQSLCRLLICCLAAAISATPAFAKQRVDLIVSHGTVVTMDGKRRILQNGAIAVQGDAITAIDATENIDAMYESGKVIDAGGGLILPGLINAHTHMSMSLFRGLADDLSLDDWLNSIFFPLSIATSPGISLPGRRGLACWRCYAVAQPRLPTCITLKRT